MVQVNSQPAEQVMHGLFPKGVDDIVLDDEKLSLELLDNVAKSRAFARVIFKMLTTAGGLGSETTSAGTACSIG